MKVIKKKIKIKNVQIIIRRKKNIRNVIIKV